MIKFNDVLLLCFAHPTPNPLFIFQTRQHLNGSDSRRSTFTFLTV